MRKIITTEAGELIDFATCFEECLTLGDTPAPDKVGRIEKVEYTTAVYEDGVTYHKYCIVADVTDSFIQEDRKLQMHQGEDDTQNRADKQRILQYADESVEGSLADTDAGIVVGDQCESNNSEYVECRDCKGQKQGGGTHAGFTEHIPCHGNAEDQEVGTEDALNDGSRIGRALHQLGNDQTENREDTDDGTDGGEHQLGVEGLGDVRVHDAAEYGAGKCQIEYQTGAFIRKTVTHPVDAAQDVTDDNQKKNGGYDVKTVG